MEISATTFVEAVRAKYEHQKGSQEGGELVGGDKTGRKQALDVLTRVFVPDSGIEGPGPDGEIAKVCGAIQELDVGGNKFDSWAPVQAIALQLPKLHWLGVDRSPLPPLEVLPEGFSSAFGGLRTLCVSGTGVVWSQFLFLASAMPKLEEVHLSANKLNTLAVPAGVDMCATLPLLQSLYLEDNELKTWEEVAPLGALSALRLLNLNHNQLVTIPTPTRSSPVDVTDGATTTAPFAHLRHLMLRGNAIEVRASTRAH